MNLVVKSRSELSGKSLFSERIINLFICFLVYSFTGWLAETIYMSIYHGHIVKRGFLIGPLCAVYGLGSISVVYILNRIKAHPFLLFIGASLITSLVELFAGILLSQLMQKRLWDYSGNFGNIMGYICLRNTIIWGIMSLFLVYIIHPRLINFLWSIPVRTREKIFYSAFIFLFLDISISVYSSLQGVNNLVWITQVLFR